MNKTNYFIKIGERYLSWVDENWYETNKEKGTLFDTISDVKDAISKLAKHYVYSPLVFEIENFNFNNAKQIKLYEKPKEDSFFKATLKPIKLKFKMYNLKKYIIFKFYLHISKKVFIFAVLKIKTNMFNKN